MAKRKAATSKAASAGKGGAAGKIRKVREAVRKAEPEARPGRSGFPVVVIGASAGGLEAYTELLRALPATTGMAFVLIQHLEPQHESVLTTLLGKVTAMPVVEVTEGMAAQPDHVYVIPPNKSMTIRRGALRLRPRSNASVPQHPIDEFAVALAQEQGVAAIGVVLSGTGSDGTYGLKAIKAAGGITFAQDPKTAQWTAMPLSVISGGSADFVLSPRRIADELARLGRHPYVAEARDLPDGSELDQICIALRLATGVDFRLYKHATVRRRIARRMALQQIPSLKKYCQILKQNMDEAEALRDDIFIHVTGFFRDPECFQALRRRVLAKLRPKGGGDPIRVWVAGCSTGEEVYSLAMLLLEEARARGDRTRMQIFGTDIREPSVELARAGVYTDAAMAGVSALRRKRFFTKTDRGFQINKAVREICIFARHDMAADPPFSRLDLISCRNVLIYMGPPLQKRVMSIFQYALKPGGVLFLGSSESIGEHSEFFTVDDRKHRIYIRKPVMGTFRGFEGPAERFRETAAPPAGRPAAASVEPDFRDEAETILWEHYTPPAMVVDPDLHIVFFQGDTSPFLAPAPGQPSFHVLKMVRPEFVVDLRGTIQKARRSGVPARKEGVRFEYLGQEAAVNIEVYPLKRRNGRKQDFLVVFQREKIRPSEVGTTGGKTSAHSARERELALTREHLRTLIEEHETAVEEMKATNEEVLSGNEELQSTNEELETAKEELQSSNEELITLNDELQHRNGELSVLTNDLTNLLVGVDIAVIVLDADLRIRRFTPVAGELFNLIPGDIGRPFSNISSNLDIHDWDGVFAEVAEHGKSVEREVTDPNNQHRYSLRVRPYKTGTNEIAGVLVVLLDTEAMQHAMDESRRAGDYAHAIVETIREGLVVVDADLRIVTVNRGFRELFGASPEEVKHQPLLGSGKGQLDAPDMRKVLREVFSKRKEVKDFALEVRLPEAGDRHLMVNAREIDASGVTLIAIEDVTDRRNAEMALHNADETLRIAAESTDLGTFDYDYRTSKIALSDIALRQFGLPPGTELSIAKLAAMIHPDDRERVMATLWPRGRTVKADGRHFALEFRGVRSAGEERWYSSWGKIYFDEKGHPVRAVGVSLDTTMRKRMEDALKEREAIVSTLFDAASQSIVAVDGAGTIRLVNPMAEKTFGYRRRDLLGQNIEMLIPEAAKGEHAKDQAGYFSSPEGNEDLVARRRDGTTFPIEVRLNTIQVIGERLIVAFISDVTERRRADLNARLHANEVQALAANLMTAQEEERRRVSRELHDQICQQLASQAIDLGGLAADARIPRALRTRLKRLEERAVKSSEATRHIAYQMHPSEVDDLGVSAAIRNLCKEFSEQSGVPVNFIDRVDSGKVPRETASCLYRIAQECLSNIGRHSHAKHATVELGTEPGVIRLAVQDDGSGFDYDAVKGRGGLGLIGMEERARLVRGKLTIAVRKGHGTRIALEIPLGG